MATVELLGIIIGIAPDNSSVLDRRDSAISFVLDKLIPTNLSSASTAFSNCNPGVTVTAYSPTVTVLPVVLVYVTDIIFFPYLL